jgi:branched-subunit amino acid permease
VAVVVAVVWFQFLRRRMFGFFVRAAIILLLAAAAALPRLFSTAPSSFACGWSLWSKKNAPYYRYYCWCFSTLV